VPDPGTREIETEDAVGAPPKIRSAETTPLVRSRFILNTIQAIVDG
jgi:hypothetical protein